MNNDIYRNRDVNAYIQDVANWHYQRNLIDGATDQSQSVKLLEEFIELYEAVTGHLSPSNLVDNLEHDIHDLLEGGRVKVEKEADKKAELKDAIGDMMVVLINIAERNNWSVEECLAGVYNEIKDRKGKMINGTFVKESDLIGKE